MLREQRGGCLRRVHIHFGRYNVGRVVEHLRRAVRNLNRDEGTEGRPDVVPSKRD